MPRSTSGTHGHVQQRKNNKLHPEKYQFLETLIVARCTNLDHLQQRSEQFRAVSGPPRRPLRKEASGGFVHFRDDRHETNDTGEDPKQHVFLCIQISKQREQMLKVKS